MKKIPFFVILFYFLILFTFFESDNVSAAGQPYINYSSHIQNIGWQDWVSKSTISGTTGESLRMEAIKLQLANAPYSGNIEYQTYIQNIGWQGWVNNGAVSGTLGESLRVEGIQIRLTGDMAKYYDVYYRSSMQGTGWGDWVKNGATGGLPGNAKRLEAIRIAIVKKPSSLKDSNVAKVVNSSTEISGSYTFIPQFIEGKTTVESFGTGWSTKVATDDPNHKWLSFIPTSDSQKGKQGVIYRNVGMYDGNQIDLKITVTNWDSYTKTKANISYSTALLGHETQGYSSVSQKWEFINHETNQPIKVNGYMTINDIDQLQGIAFSDAQLNSLDDLFTTNDPWIKYDHSDGYHYFYESELGSSTSDDKKASFTMTFTQQSSISFDWRRNYEITGVAPDSLYDLDHLDLAQYFSFSGKKLARTEIVSPEKYVNTSTTSDLKLEKSNTLASYNKEFSYEVIHRVHDEYSEFYYSNYQMKDVVPNGLTVKSVKVYDEEGRDVSSLFDNKSSGNTIQLNAKSTVLKDPTFYGNTYRFEIKVIPSAINVLNGLVVNNQIEWKNTASMTINSIVKNSNSVSTKLIKRTVTENHIDKLDNTVLVTSSTKKFDGESYSYSPKENLTYNRDGYMFPYTPVSSEKQEGIVQGKDLTLNFYYTRPNTVVGLKKIQIYTEEADRGLPLKLLFDVKVMENATEWESDPVNITIYNKDKGIQVLKKTLTVKELENMAEWTIPSQYLEVNKSNNYEVKIEIQDAKKVAILEGQEKINTDGYTSSEMNIKLNTSGEESYQYKGVVMTEREIKKDMKLYYETLTLPTLKSDPIKSGYGMDLNKKVTYKNDLEKLTSIKAKYLVDNDLIDSYIQYGQEDGKSLVNAAISTESKTNNTLQQTFTLPKVYVEKNTGHLFSENQKNTQDSRIKYELKDGGNKLYIPIWIDNLGNYKVQFQSIDPVGANKVTFDITDSINVYAYMYGYMGSDTIKEDEILIEPVDPKNPFPDGVPEGWSEEDLNWLKQ